MEIGRKIYYDKATGNVILDTREKYGDFLRDNTTEEDFASYTVLQGIVQTSVGLIRCDYGYETNNFQMYNYHIDITKTPINETAIIWDTTNPIGASLDDIKVAKLAQINDLSNQAIYNTFASVAFDGVTSETYACDQLSQSRINGEVTTAMAVLGGYSSETVSWKNTNQTQCVTWLPKNMINLGNDLHKFVTSNTDYLEALTVYVNELTTVDLVNAVTYGMVIPTTATSSTITATTKV